MKIRTFFTALAICALPLASNVTCAADPFQKQLPRQQIKQPILNQPVQQPAPKQPILQPGVNTGPSQGAPAIVLEVTRFSITPNAPNAGDNVQIRATIRNSGTGTVASVPWGIGPQGALTMGAQTNVTPGSSFDIAAMWNATGGQQRLQVYIDPSGNQIRNTSGNRMREIAVNVAGSGSNVASSGDPMQNQPMQQHDQSMQNPLLQLIQQKLQQVMSGTGANQGAPQGGFTPGGNQMQQQGAGMAPAQNAPPGAGTSGANQMQQQVAAAPAQSALPVMLEITSFSITPAAPNVGDSVQIKATVRNSGTQALASVPWGISLQGALSMGEQADVPAGSDFDIVATWKTTQEGGPYTLRVIIDPAGSLINSVPEASRSSNRDIFVKPAGNAPPQR